MARTQVQKDGMIKTSMELARLLAEWNKAYNAFKEEYDSQDYGTVIQAADLSGLALSDSLTKLEWTDGVAALDAVSTAVELNKTNIYAIATGK